MQNGVLDLAFDGSDSVAVTHMVTVCKDASVRLWDINGEPVFALHCCCLRASRMVV